MEAKLKNDVLTKNQNMLFQLKKKGDEANDSKRSISNELQKVKEKLQLLHVQKISSLAKLQKLQKDFRKKEEVKMRMKSSHTQVCVFLTIHLKIKTKKCSCNFIFIDQPVLARRQRKQWCCLREAAAPPWCHHFMFKQILISLEMLCTSKWKKKILSIFYNIYLEVGGADLSKT